jgi:indole-3-glycerol phosphate synthase
MLNEILANKRAELPGLRKRALPAPPALRRVDLSRAAGQPLRLIAEIKRRSPSAGALSTKLGVPERARAYEDGGAAMVSVLCDAVYFDGAYEHLALARSATTLPLLCKEFVLDEVQLDAARAFGADAILLIVRCLTPLRLAQLVAAATARGLVSLVEVHAPEEVPVALDAGATLIGVNARDLETLEMDAPRARRVLESLPDGVTRLHLSGIHTPDQLAELARSTAHAALLGETLMRLDDPRDLLRDLAAAAAGRTG